MSTQLNFRLNPVSRKPAYFTTFTEAETAAIEDGIPLDDIETRCPKHGWQPTEWHSGECERCILIIAEAHASYLN